jgi:hypothetical protein
MLGVRREGVTCAALKLQRAGLIDYTRGRVVVLDRGGLEARSCECYDVVKSEYERLASGTPDLRGTQTGIRLPAPESVRHRAVFSGARPSPRATGRQAVCSANV